MKQHELEALLGYRLYIPELNQNGRPTMTKNRNEFMSKAEPLRIDLGGTTTFVSPKQFSTGSVGWYTNGKITVMVDGKPVVCAYSVNLTAVGSKEWE